MVKGTSRRVIVVRPPDQQLFEQAIFLLKEDAAGQQGVTAQQVVQEAKEAADSYLRKHAPGKRGLARLGKYRGWLWFLAGAACTGIAVMILL